MSDDEEQFNPRTHSNLLQAINNLRKTQHIRKSTRNEPKTQQNEFQLVKGGTVVSSKRTSTTPIGVNDIVNILKTTKKHLDTGKKLKTAQDSKKVLKKPLEKPAAERIKRKIGYENVKKKLMRWDAVVATNRAAESLVFPLESETIYINTSGYSKPLQLAIKSDLAHEMEESDAKLKALRKERRGDTTDDKELEIRENELLKKKLTRDELIAKRKELAYLRMRESQKSAKARLKNKIKSKKYHKILRRQKLQQQIKDFELLQKTCPEVALEKLNALEKSRVLERASLRHKNTGTWAKNLQIRAKYDKDVRKDLSEQLQISRQLTEKKNDTESNDDDEDVDESSKQVDMDEDNINDPFNPWTRSNKNAEEKNNTENDGENWRKYWLTRNDNEKKMAEYKKLTPIGDSAEDEENNKRFVKPVVTKKANKKDKVSSKELVGKAKSTKSKKKTIVENGWAVEEIDSGPVSADVNIDDLFDAEEDKISYEISKKVQRLNKHAKELSKVKKTKRQVKKKGKGKDELKNLKDLSFKKAVKKAIVDEELNYEETQDKEKNMLEKQLEAAANVEIEQSVSTNNAKITTTPTPQTDAIDPNKVASLKLKQNFNVLTTMNDYIEDVDVEYEGDVNEDADNDHQMAITEAFEDDDVVADFSKDKAKDAELKNTEIDLFMPGWGSWAGAGITTDSNSNTNKRIVLKLAKKETRRDDNKNGVYINEGASKQLRTHLVSDVPFPFKSLQDYEASIRAPIGRNYVTETAFRLLTRPEVITRKGKVIDPMDESELITPSRRPKTVVHRRIEHAAKNANTKANKKN